MFRHRTMYWFLPALLVSLAGACVADQPQEMASTTSGEDALSSNGINASLSVTSDWTSGYCANVTLANAGTTQVNSWQVVVGTGGSTVTQLWSASYTTSGNQITVSNSGYNSEISPGSSVSFGFCGTGTGRPSLVSVSVNGVTSSSSSFSLPSSSSSSRASSSSSSRASSSSSASSLSSSKSSSSASSRSSSSSTSISTTVFSTISGAPTLTIDLSAPIGPVTHLASGSLYGITETLPASVSGLIAPLRPRMFTAPAADQQQPVGDAIVVAGRVAPTGGTVTIRLADWFKSWPYAFTSMTDWFSKVDQTVARKKAAGLTNIYGYEIWNEPDGTWKSTNPLAFNQFWQQTYAHIRSVDPGVKIVGPSYSYYNDSSMSSFLSFCKTNNVLPDIVSWHSWGFGVHNDVQTYRALEKRLGIGPLPISLNEYSGSGDINDEGKPGVSAPIIAAMERSLVDSACISFWDVAHPGRLGSLLATDTQTNGGWFLYKWYGDMSGKMVTTTSSLATGSGNLDGFANVETTTGTASVVFGGINNGGVNLIVKGFKAASSLGSIVHAVVEHTPWVNRSTVVTAASTVTTANVAVTSDQILVSISNINSNDGYRLNLTKAQ